jgi:hypothetical protein
MQPNALTAPQEAVICPEEELQMTFQVALVGTDGIILGSDRRLIYSISPTEGNHYAPNQFGEGRKFAVRSDDSLICAYAGSPSSRPTAQGIANAQEYSASLSDYQMEQLILSKSRDMQGQRWGRDEVLVARASDLQKVLLMARWPQGDPTFNEFTCWVTTGNNSLPARFVLEHFFECRPVAQLEQLAILTLSCAASENPYAIGGGFDLMFLSATGVEWKTYPPGDERVEQVRARFDGGAKSVLYPPKTWEEFRDMRAGLKPSSVTLPPKPSIPE